MNKSRPKIVRETYRSSVVINAPLTFVFEWCTDFQESDPLIVGSKSKRKILEETDRRRIFTSYYKGNEGEEQSNVNIVTLNPPHSWHLDQFGEEDDEIGDYVLTSLGKQKTKLSMVFKEKWKKPSTMPRREEYLALIKRHWDSYASALEKDYLRKKKSA